MGTFTALVAPFPLTSPIPAATSVPGLINNDHLSIEHDLSRNPDQITRWNQYISTIKDEVLAAELGARGKASELEEAVLGTKLSTPEGRLGLQRLTDVYERAIKQFPRSFRLWKEYLAVRSSYVLGKAGKPLKLEAPKKKRGDDGQGRSMVEWLEAGKGEVEELQEGERDVESEWAGGLDGVVGWEEWRSLAAAHERALMWLPTVRSFLCGYAGQYADYSRPQMPRLWLSYLTLFTHPSCPAALSHSHARKTFDRALRSLPPSLHERIWHVYLPWSESIGGETAIRVWRRYLLVRTSSF